MQQARANPRRAIFVKNRRRCRIAVSDRTAARGSPAPSPPEAERAASSPKSAYGTNRQCQHFSGLLAGSAKKTGLVERASTVGGSMPPTVDTDARLQGLRKSLLDCGSTTARAEGPFTYSRRTYPPVHGSAKCDTHPKGRDTAGGSVHEWRGPERLARDSPNQHGLFSFPAYV